MVNVSITHAMTNLYLGKYRSILYFPTLNWLIISSPLKACMICLSVSYSLHNYLFFWSSIPRHFVKFIKFGVGFLYLLITYKRLHLDKKMSWSRASSLRGFPSVFKKGLVFWSSSASFAVDVWMWTNPKNFPTWAHLNRRFPSVSTIVLQPCMWTKLSLTNCEDIFFSSCWSRKICIRSPDRQHWTSSASLHFAQNIPAVYQRLYNGVENCGLSIKHLYCLYVMSSATSMKRA